MKVAIVPTQGVTGLVFGGLGCEFLCLGSNLTGVKFSFIWGQECVKTKTLQSKMMEKVYQQLPTKEIKALLPPHSGLPIM